MKAIALGGWKRALGRRARCASTPAPWLVGQSPWLPLSGLPAKKLVVRYARFCDLARSAIWSKRGPPAHLAQVEDCKSDMCETVASVDYSDAGMARGSQGAVGQALQPICLQRAHGPICSQGVRGYLSTQASVNKP